MEHSRIFPFSSAHRWTGSACPGSALMCLGEDSPGTDISREGEACHQVAAVMLEAFKQRTDSNGVPAGEKMIDTAADNGVIITEEMFDVALAYYQIVTAVVGTKVEDKARLMVESKVAAPSIDEEANGTCDAYWYQIEGNILHAWDLKAGYRSVVAEGNRQLIGYAQAICETQKYEALNPRLRLNIVQPRCYDGRGTLRYWHTTLEDLRGHVNDLRHGAALVRAGRAECQSGDWCYECDAGYKCPALASASGASVDVSFQAVPHLMTNEGLAYELTVTEQAADRLKQRLTAISAEAERRVRNGQLIPGRRMQETMGKRKFSCDADLLNVLGGMLGVDFTERKPMTPAAAERTLKSKGIDGAVIQPYIYTPKTGVKLARDDGTTAKQVFSGRKL